MTLQVLTLRNVQQDARSLATQIVERYGRREYHLIAIPRGGVLVAYLVAAEMENQHGCAVGMSLPSEHTRASSGDVKVIAIDDILVTGAAMARVLGAGEASSAAVLYVKGNTYSEKTVLHTAVVDRDLWVQFPWEQGDDDQGRPEDAVRRLIEFMGDDPNREGLRETPARVLRYLEEVKRQPAPSVAKFETEVNDLIVTAGIPFSSICEHHMLPYWGEAAVGYIPQGTLLGLSKAARAVEMVAGGLTLQEHLTHEAADVVMEWTGSPNVAVLTTAIHSCMVNRGVKAIGSRTASSAMRGTFLESGALRAEFLSIIDQAKSLA